MANPYPQLPGTMVVDQPADPWDAAFAQYRQALVDLDGDGVPDAVVSAPQPDNRARQMIARRAMSGREPTLTPQDMDRLDRRRVVSEENNQAVERGVGSFLLGQPIRAGLAIRDAYNDPSIRNVADAGLQTAVAAAPFMPLRYAMPAIGTQIAADSVSTANAQPAGVEARLRGMSQQELMAYQRMIGVNPDGRIGPATLSAASRYEADQQARSSQAAESDRIRAQGDADARREAARIEAESRARLAEERGRSELSAEEAQRPFLQRNPGYSAYAPYVAGAAAAALPAVGALLSRRSATMPQRQAAQAVDASVAQFNRSPTPMTARTVSEAASAPLPATQPNNLLANVMDYGSLGVGASLPSAAVVAPYFIDYMQPSGTPTREAASQEFTLDKLRERMTGPFALGLAMAGGGRFLGEKAGAAFMNPAPRGANAAQANAIRGMVERSGGDDAALTNNLLASLRGGQGTATEAQRLRGISNAQPPNVRFDDMTIPAPPQHRALPPPDPSDAAGLPPPGGQGGQPLPAPGGRPTPQPDQQPPPAPVRRTRSSLNDSQKLEAQQRFLEGASVDDLAQQYGVSKASMASIKRNADELVKQSGGDRQRALERLLDYIKVRSVSYAAAPAVAAGPINNLLANYTGQQPTY